jgi:WhiB family redox-sensing transcriptional regulator
MSDPLDFLRQAAAAATPEPVRRRHNTEATDARSKWAWTNDAACLGVDADVFYPVIAEPYPADVIADANAYCTTCPVRVACHDWALHNEPDGIWAGTTPRARRRIRRSLAIADPATLGRDQVHDETVGLTPPLWELDVQRSAREVAQAAGVSSRTVVRHRVARRTTA